MAQGLADLNEGQRKLKEGQRNLEKGQRNLEEDIREIKRQLDNVIEQTVILTEFREETNHKLDTVIAENEAFKEIIGKHEVDIRTIKRMIV